jgi:hypothetical protein
LQTNFNPKLLTQKVKAVASAFRRSLWKSKITRNTVPGTLPSRCPGYLILRSALVLLEDSFGSRTELPEVHLRLRDRCEILSHTLSVENYTFSFARGILRTEMASSSGPGLPFTLQVTL